MIPRPGPEHLLTLEQQRRAIEGYGLQQARDMLLKMCHLSLQQDLILRAATRRIAELECQIALSGHASAAAAAEVTAMSRPSDRILPVALAATLAISACSGGASGSANPSIEGLRLVRSQVARTVADPADARAAGEALSAFGADLFRALAADEPNVVISPASIAQIGRAHV